MKNQILIVTICFLPFIEAIAEVDVRSSTLTQIVPLDSLHKPVSFFRNIGTDIATALDDGVELVTAPARFDTKDWLITGSVIGGTALAFTLDTDVRSVMLRNRRDAFGTLSSYSNAYGNGVYAVAAGAGLYFGGIIAENSRVRETGAMTIEALIYAGIITTIVKTVFGRSRPYINEGPFKYRWFQLQDKYLALPSGHCVVAFAFSSVLSQQIDCVAVTILLYGFASVTVLQRMYEDRHWLSDTVLGSVIGYFVGDTVVSLHRKHSSYKRQSSLLLYPILSPQCTGMGVTFGF